MSWGRNLKEGDLILVEKSHPDLGHRWEAEVVVKLGKRECRTKEGTRVTLQYGDLVGTRSAWSGADSAMRYTEENCLRAERENDSYADRAFRRKAAERLYALSVRAGMRRFPTSADQVDFHNALSALEEMLKVDKGGDVA